MSKEKVSSVPFVGTPAQEKELREAISKLKKTHQNNDALMPALQKGQGIYGYLPMEVQKIVAEELDVYLEEVYGVVTFYSQFSLEPKGKYNVSVCLGTACYVKGAGKIYEELQKELGMETGCTEDGLFSIEACRCIGACGLAPLISVNDDVYGRLVEGDVAKVIAKYREAN